MYALEPMKYVLSKNLDESVCKTRPVLNSM